MVSLHTKPNIMFLHSDTYCRNHIIHQDLGLIKFVTVINSLLKIASK